MTPTTLGPCRLAAWCVVAMLVGGFTGIGICTTIVCGVIAARGW